MTITNQRLPQNRNKHVSIFGKNGRGGGPRAPQYCGELGPVWISLLAAIHNVVDVLCVRACLGSKMTYGG